MILTSPVMSWLERWEFIINFSNKNSNIGNDDNDDDEKVINSLGGQIIIE